MDTGYILVPVLFVEDSFSEHKVSVLGGAYIGVSVSDVDDFPIVGAVLLEEGTLAGAALCALFILVRKFNRNR